MLLSYITWTRVLVFYIRMYPSTRLNILTKNYHDISPIQSVEASIPMSKCRGSDTGMFGEIKDLG